MTTRKELLCAQVQFKRNFSATRLKVSTGLLCWEGGFTQIFSTPLWHPGTRWHTTPWGHQLTHAWISAALISVWEAEHSWGCAVCSRAVIRLKRRLNSHLEATAKRWTNWSRISTAVTTRSSTCPATSLPPGRGTQTNCWTCKKKLPWADHTLADWNRQFFLAQYWFENMFALICVTISFRSWRAVSVGSLLLLSLSSNCSAANPAPRHCYLLLWTFPCPLFYCCLPGMSSLLAALSNVWKWQCNNSTLSLVIICFIFFKDLLFLFEQFWPHDQQEQEEGGEQGRLGEGHPRHHHQQHRLHCANVRCQWGTVHASVDLVHLEYEADLARTRPLVHPSSSRRATGDWPLPHECHFPWALPPPPAWKNCAKLVLFPTWSAQRMSVNKRGKSW